MSFRFENINTAYPNSEQPIIHNNSLGYTTNNKYPEFPPLMSDGRAITASYQPEAVRNEEIIQNNNIQSNWQYRRYLTDNAVDVMRDNFRQSCNDNGYYKRYADISRANSVQDEMTNTPHRFESLLDNSTPLGHSSSDLKSLYLSREQLNSQKVSPVMTQEELLRFQR